MAQTKIAYSAKPNKNVKQRSGAGHWAKFDCSLSVKDVSIGKSADGYREFRHQTVFLASVMHHQVGDDG
jgi:hypothetical protein